MKDFHRIRSREAKLGRQGMDASDPSNRMNWAVGREESGMEEGPSPSKEEGREGNLNDIVLLCQIGPYELLGGIGMPGCGGKGGGIGIPRPPK